MSRKDRAIFRRVVPRAVRTAARVLTVSERTKADLVELYDVPAERIVVTPNGVDPAFGPGSGTRDYVLSVGAIQRRKNQLAALDAAQAAGLPLVVVGPDEGPGLAEELRRRGARLEGYVAKERLAELYRGAACLVQSSRYEGFGLPVLEAMASGTPVVAVPDPALARGGRRRRDLRRGGRACRRDPPSARRARSARRGRARTRSRIQLARGRGADARRLPGDTRDVKVSAVVVSHGHADELARSLPVPRRAGRRDARDREPSGLGSRRPDGCACPREPASARLRGERQPRNRVDRRASTSSSRTRTR